MSFDAIEPGVNSFNILKLRLVEETTPTELPLIRFPEALNCLRDGIPLADSDVDGICAIRVNDYVPLICTALHNGATFPFDLEKSCLLTEAERRFEEDPHTAELLAKLPLVLSGSESRYFYDLNRSEEFATINDVFNRKVWRTGQHPVRQQALSRHRQFYQLISTLIEQLIDQYGSCLILDLHSYNGSKISREAPLFNLGTCAINTSTHRQLLDHFLGSLASVDLPGLTTRVAENDVFEGRGRFVNWISRTYPQALPLCLEIKKDYCDERSGKLYPELFNSLQTGLTCAITDLFTSYRESYLQEPCQQIVHV